MADKEYRTITGFIQFEPEQREIESLNLTVTDFTVRAAGEAGALVRVTAFPEFEDYEFNQGDAVMIDGPFEARTGQTKSGDKREFLNLRASRIQLNGELLTPKEREVANKKVKTTRKF